MPETLPEFLERWRDQPVPLTDLLTEHGLLALAHVADTEGWVLFQWQAFNVGADPVEHMLDQGFYFLPPLPLATTLQSEDVRARWRTDLQVGICDIEAGHTHLVARVPLAVLLGLPNEPGLGQAVLAELATVAEQPGRFHLSISSDQSPSELRLRGGVQPAPPALARWQAAVQQGLLAERRRVMEDEGDPAVTRMGVTTSHLDEGHLRGRAALPQAAIPRSLRRSWG